MTSAKTSPGWCRECGGRYWNLWAHLERGCNQVARPAGERCHGLVRRHFNLTLRCELEQGHPGACGLHVFACRDPEQAWVADQRELNGTGL